MADHVFISYAHEDRQRVVALAEPLRQQGWDVFLDDQIPGAQPWAEELHKAIRTSRVVIIMLSPDAMHSQHVINEIHVALGTHRPIVPVMLEDSVLSPGIELLVGGLQIVDYTDSSTWQFNDVVDAVEAAARGSRIHKERRTMKIVGNLIAGLGLLLVIGGMGMFFLEFYQAVSNPDPFAGPDGPQMVLSFIVFFVGGVVGGIGEAIRRTARRR